MDVQHTDERGASSSSVSDPSVLGLGGAVDPLGGVF